MRGSSKLFPDDVIPGSRLPEMFSAERQGEWQNRGPEATPLTGRRLMPEVRGAR